MYAIYDLRFSPDGRCLPNILAGLHSPGLGRSNGKRTRPASQTRRSRLDGDFLADTKRIATASMDETARVRTETTQPLSKPLGQDNSRNRMRVHFSPDAIWLLTGSDDRGVRVWEIGGVMSSATTVASAPVVQSTPANHPGAIGANTPPAFDQGFAAAFAQKLVNGISGNEIDLLVSLYDDGLFGQGTRWSGSDSRQRLPNAGRKQPGV